MKTVFLGSAPFGIPTLERLAADHVIRAVVTTPPRHQGRGMRLHESPIAVRSRELGIEPILSPEVLTAPELAAKLRACEADLFVVVAFRLLPESLFSIPPLGTINIHASLLPKFRGPAPIQRAIEAGERETGVTIFRIDAGIDTGAILSQRSLPIDSHETTPELYDRLSVVGAEALLETLGGLERGEIIPRLQPSAQATRAPRLSKAEAHIDWRQPATTLFNRIRAFIPFPGTYTIIDGKRLGVQRAEVSDATKSGQPGSIVAVTDSCFEVQCAPGILRITDVKPEGRRQMNAAEYLRGNQLRKGMRCTWILED